MDNMWHALIKSIRHIFTKRSHSKFHPTPLSKEMVREWEDGPNNFI